MKKNNLVHEIVNEIKKHDYILVTSHVIPDGDNIGSTLALGLALKALGKKVIMINNDLMPQQYRFLKGSEEIQLPSALKTVPSLCIAVDLTGLDRVGDALQNFVHKEKPVVINVDHHVSNSYFGHLNLVDGTVSAAGELVYDLILALGVSVDVNMAEALYVAISTDTGSFQYESTKPKTLEIAAKLLEAGVEPGKINQSIYDSKSLIALKLLEKALSTLSVSEDGKMAYIWVDLRTMNKLNAENEHCEGLVNYPRILQGVEIALFFRQIAKNRVKVAFRSKGQADVNHIAGIFGGGGHTKAAGCSLDGDLSTVIPKVTSVVEEELKKI